MRACDGDRRVLLAPRDQTGPLVPCAKNVTPRFMKYTHTTFFKFLASSTHIRGSERTAYIAPSVRLDFLG